MYKYFSINGDNSQEPLRTKKYGCTYEGCNEVFRREVAFDKHIFTHTGIVRVYQFSNKILSNLLVFHFQKKHICTIANCSKSYTNSTHLKRHIQTAHEFKEDDFKCPVEGCNQSFSTDSNMKRHLKRCHDEVRTYDCPECGEQFRRKMKLKIHLVLHTGEFAHKCQECGEGFTNFKRYRHHKTVAHTLDGKKCEECDRMFEKWSDFVAHRKEVHATKFNCPDCDKVFYSKCRLKIHSICHKNKSDLEELFVCPFESCDKSFKRRSYLTAHIRQKHGERQFKCEECGTALSTKQKLRQHVDRIHTQNDSHMKVPRPVKEKSKRKDLGVKKKSTLGKIAGIEADKIVEELLISGQGSRLQIDYSPVACGAESGTDTESDTSLFRQNYAF